MSNIKLLHVSLPRRHPQGIQNTKVMSNKFLFFYVHTVHFVQFIVHTNKCTTNVVHLLVWTINILGVKIIECQKC